MIPEQFDTEKLRKSVEQLYSYPQKVNQARTERNQKKIGFSQMMVVFNEALAFCYGFYWALESSDVPVFRSPPTSKEETVKEKTQKFYSKGEYAHLFKKGSLRGQEFVEEFVRIRQSNSRKADEIQQTIMFLIFEMISKINITIDGKIP